MVNIEFECNGTNLSEAIALDFGTVQAGTPSAIKKVTVTNTGDSDAQQCQIRACEASIVNGFAINSQQGTADETFKAQTFAASETSGSWYDYGVVGIGKNFSNKTGGVLSKTSGSDSFVTRWTPPENGTSGQKVWGNVFSCVYV